MKSSCRSTAARKLFEIKIARTKTGAY
jgi:hypothetical protein